MGRGERAAPQGLDGQGRPAEEVAAPTHASRGSHHRLVPRPAGRRRRLRRRPARHRLGHGRAAERLLPVLARCADDRRLRRDFHPIRAPGADRAVRDAGAVSTRSQGAVAGGGPGRSHPVDRPLRRRGALHRLLHALDRAPHLARRARGRHPLSARHVLRLREVVPGTHAQGSARGVARPIAMGIENLLLGFHVAITPYNLFVAVVGITLGTIIGVLPGLGGANGVAILLPLTFTMPPTSAIILLTSLYWGALFGGAITSILFNIPGEPWSVATTFDGYPLARQGQGGQALTAAFTSSFVGALFSIVLITLFAPLLAEIALRFGPPEFFAIQLLTFSSFVGLGGGNPLKSLVSILLGFILAAVGLDIVTGQLRMTFGLVDLMKGFDFIVAVIGLFGIGEILLSVEEGLSFHGVRTGMNLRVVLDTWRILPRYARTFVRGAFIGFWMGFKPGGATPASFMSYAFAKRFSRNPERFGKGELEGVVAPETAAHAAGVAAMLPMLTLGIPGSPTAAVMLGGLIIRGLQPGPLLFKEKPEFVWGLIASMYTGNIIGVLMVLAFVPLFAAILRIPFAILTPVIVVVCAIGSYAVHNNMIDIWYMVIFGVVGYVFKKLDYPLAPLVLALVLGDLAENALRQSLIMSQGSLAIFIARPISGVITAVAILFFALPVLTPWWRRLRGVPAVRRATREI